MSSPVIIETEVFHLERVRNSVNGNPRYRVSTSDGTFLTSSDHEFVYDIEIGWRSAHSRPARITLTKSRRISDLTYLD